MNLHQRQLRMFVTLAQEGHFSRASERLHISQPALSRAVQELESQLGVKLFRRTTRQLSLTPEGQRLLPRAQRLLRDMADMADDLRARGTGVRGTVTMALGAAFGAVLLPAVLKQFCDHYPRVQVRLLDDNSMGITRRVLQAEADIGIGSPMGDTAALVCERLLSAPLGLLSSAPAVAGAQTQASDRPSLPLLRESEDTSIMNILRMRGSALVADMDRGIEVSSLGLQLALVRAGMGLAVVSALGASHPMAQGMRFEALQPAIEREIFLMTQRTRELSEPARAMVFTLMRLFAQADAHWPGVHRLVRMGKPAAA
jgi:LysR family transcriptional regulator, carnitine catabolism transcriptional activator